MRYDFILIPGRHHLVTRFQTVHLKRILARDDVAKDVRVVWAVTSANHAGTRSNPLAGTRRIAMVEAVAAVNTLPSLVFGINNMSPKPDFAHYLIEEIRLESQGRTDMTPANTLVVCSTPDVAAQYDTLGFTVDRADAEYEGESVPWDVVEEIVAAGPEWRVVEDVRAKTDPVCLDYYDRYGLGDEIVGVFADPLIDNDDGDITTTRDYASYRRAFEDGARRKVADFEAYVKPGRILDVGSATGETIKVLAAKPELFESDFYGVEAARPLYQLAQQRKESGEFGNANVYFYQRNIMQSSLFKPGSLDTVITMALTHEVESYLGRAELIRFLKRMYDITAPGGVYINYDVVAPDNKERHVYALLNESDGDNPDNVFAQIPADAVPAFLRSLSTRARFRRFAGDFRRDEGDGMAVVYKTIDKKEYAVLRYADLCDFLAKKDYVNSWASEMHERFCFWDYGEWTAALEEAGFTVGSASRPVMNEWLIANRFAPAAKIYEITPDGLHECDPPRTNILTFAYKDA